MKRSAIVLTLLMVASTPVSAAFSVRGDYDWIAECVFLKFDPLSPGNVRYANLRLHEAALVTLDIPAGAGTMRNVRAMFSRAGDGLVAVSLEGSVGGHFTNKARDLIAECSAEAPMTKQSKAKEAVKPQRGAAK